MYNILQVITCFLMVGDSSNSTQYSNLNDEVVAIAEVSRIGYTGKVHQSVFFNFIIKETISGKWSHSKASSQEIFMDYGGAHILAKIYPGYRATGDTAKSEEVIIKFSKNRKNDEEHSILLLWVAEKPRLRSLTELEKLMRAGDKIQLPFGMLEEDAGRFFFKKEEKLMVAVENHLGSGIWLVAQLEDRMKSK